MNIALYITNPSLMQEYNEHDMNAKYFTSLQLPVIPSSVSVDTYSRPVPSRHRDPKPTLHECGDPSPSNA